MKKLLLSLMLFALLNICAKAQTISYGANSKVYYINTPITPSKPKHSDTTMTPYYVKSMSYTGQSLSTTVSVTFSPSGDAYIGQDLSGTNYTIVKANTSGVSTNFAQTTNILGLAYNNNDACIYTSTGRTKLAKVASNGMVTPLSVVYDGNTNYTFGQLADIKFNSNYTKAYLLDKNKNAVYKLDMGTLTMELVAGTEGTAGDADGVGATAKFKAPTAITLANNTDLYIADRDNFLIKKINVDEGSTDYGKVETVAGASGAGNNINTDEYGTAARFIYPSGIAYQNDKLYITDYNGYCIREIDINNSYKVTTVAGTPGTYGDVDGLGSNAKLRYAFMNDINPADGNMYYASRNFAKIIRFTIGKYVVSPSLPTGLTLNETTGEISGTPTSITAATGYTVQLLNGLGTEIASETLTIEVKDTALPVTLKNFEAKKQTNGNINITWVTVSENNNNHFILSKSTDGVNFTKLTEKASLGNLGGNYNFVDIHVNNGANYYKLTQVDKDGTSEELGIKIINGGISAANNWKVYPNPMNKECSVYLPSAKVGQSQTINIYATNGTLLHSAILKVNNTNNINIKLPTNLNSGTYMMEIKGFGTKKIMVK